VTSDNCWITIQYINKSIKTRLYSEITTHLYTGSAMCHKSEVHN